MADFNFGKAKEKTFDTEIVWFGDKLEFQYKPGLLDNDWIKENEKANDSEDLEGMVAAMLHLMVSWNATDSEGKPLPLKVKPIMDAKIPLPLVGMIGSRMIEVANDGGQSVKKQR